MKVKQIKFIAIILVILACETTVSAQTSTSSPYSRFGIGELEPSVFGQSLSLAGTGIALRSPFDINPLNPASYSSFYPPRNLAKNNSLGQLKYPNFIFQAGIRFKQTNAESATSVNKSFDYGLRSMAIGFFINKYWAASVGFLPYSSVGYQINTEENLSVGNYSQNIQNVYLGKGGISRIYFGNAFKYKQFSVGLNTNYLFGKEIRTAETAANGNAYSSIISTQNKTNIKGIMFDFGTQFTDTVGQIIYTIGAIYTGNTNLNSLEINHKKQSFLINTLTVTDTISLDTVSNGTFSIPAMYGFGFSLKTDKWLFASDFKTQDWSKALLFGQKNAALSKSMAISFGSEFTPDLNSDNFFKKISYRMGAKYSNSYLNVGGTQLKDYAITAGFGIPITTKAPGLRTPFLINLGFEAGQRGSTKNGMLMENYYMVNLNFNMGAIWFVKREFR